MKNLENFGVQELNSSDSKEISGGGIVGLMVSAFFAGYAFEKYIIQKQ